MNSTKTILVISVIALILGGGLGYWVGIQGPASSEPEASFEEGRGQPLYYRNTMNPAVTSPVPAKDAMGMDYQPVYADDLVSGVPGTVQIDAATVQSIGVRTAIAERRVLSRAVRALGRIDMDEERVARIHPKIEGWVENLQVDSTGDQVRAGEVLLSVYSPQLVTSQEEFVIASRTLANAIERNSDAAIQSARDVVESAKRRLELLDVPAHQIERLQRTGEVTRALHIHSPFNGVVMQIGAREGQYISPNTELYLLADLSQVWVYVDVYEYELPWIAVGDRAEMRVVAVPGTLFEGTITYVYPYMEQSTRSVKVRLEFDNSDGLLKPEMFANVTIEAERQINAITVPSEAVVRSGTAEQVFVVVGEGRFEPRRVNVGVVTEGITQILSGIAPGEEVVTSAQFLIDSESKLSEATAKMVEGSPEQASPDPEAKDQEIDPDESGQ